MSLAFFGKYAPSIRIALRELRGGLKGFRIFVACLALGVASIASVGSLSSSLINGISSQGQSILGGDLSFALTQRQASPDELSFLRNLGDVSEISTLRAMARVKNPDVLPVLGELKSVDGIYPLYGDIVLSDSIELDEALENRNGTWGMVAEKTMLDRLQVGVGDIINVGELNFEVRAQIIEEPDKLSAGLTFGPRMLISYEALGDTGLLRPGSLVNWHYRVKLEDDSLSNIAQFETIRDESAAKFPSAGWKITDRTNASPRLQKVIEDFNMILTLVGLTVLVVGGVGVANAVRSYLAGKQKVIATLKCLGAYRRDIFVIYSVQTAILASIGIAIGLIIGAFLPWTLSVLLSGVLPITLEPGLNFKVLMIALSYGFLVALAFSLWPLGRSVEVHPGALFRDIVAPSKKRPPLLLIFFVGLTILALAALAILSAHEQRFAIMYVCATAGAFVILTVVSRLTVALAKSAPRFSSPELRLAIANIHRPGALTNSIILSLGLGLTLLVTLALVDTNLTKRITTSIPDEAPSFYFLDIQRAQSEQFKERITELAPQGELRTVPMLRGRITEIKGERARAENFPPDVRWVLNGDRGITYADNLPEGARLGAGEWWDVNYDGPPLVSFDQRVGEAFGLEIGDEIKVNVLGRNIVAKVANFRIIKWETLSINFVMMFSSNTFAGAPHMQLATLALPGDDTDALETKIMQDVSLTFPQATIVRIKSTLESVNEIFQRIMWAIRAASSVTILASILVLGGALAAGHHHRIKDAVILKTVGATRKRLLKAFGWEFLLLGFAATVFSIFAGSLAAYFVLNVAMRSPFDFIPSAVIGTAVFGLATALILGLTGTWRVLSVRPWRFLRAD